MARKTESENSLPTPYFHVVFTLPEPITVIAHENKDLIYDVWGLSSITAHL